MCCCRAELPIVAGYLKSLTNEFHESKRAFPLFHFFRQRQEGRFQNDSDDSHAPTSFLLPKVGESLFSAVPFWPLGMGRLRRVLLCCVGGCCTILGRSRGSRLATPVDVFD